MGNHQYRLRSPGVIAIGNIYQWVRQIAAPFLLIISLCLFVYQGAYPEKVALIQRTFISVVQPALAILGAPVRTFQQGVEYVQKVAFVFQENQALRDENSRLHEETMYLRARAGENDKLRALLKMPSALPLLNQAVTARVIATPDMSFMNSFIIWAGQKEGVQKDHAVVTERGVVGRTVDVGPHATRVLLLTDISSRIPVYVGDERVPAILGGTNSDMPELYHVSPLASLKLGDTVVTSGQGGIFPSGLTIGRIASLDDSVPAVAIAADLDHTEFVKVLDYTVPPLHDSP